MLCYSLPSLFMNTSLPSPHLAPVLPRCVACTPSRPRQEDQFGGSFEFARVGRDPQRLGSKCFLSAEPGIPTFECLSCDSITRRSSRTRDSCQNMLGAPHVFSRRHMFSVPPNFSVATNRKKIFFKDVNLKRSITRLISAFRSKIMKTCYGLPPFKCPQLLWKQTRKLGSAGRLYSSFGQMHKTPFREYLKKGGKGVKERKRGDQTKLGT